MKKEIYFIAILILVFSSCTSHTEKTTDKIRKILPNGKNLLVEKTNKDTSSKGVFTKHTYSVSHNFEYSISIDKGDIKWYTEIGEPKNILFCRDTAYIRYLKEKTIRTKNLDSIDTIPTYKYHKEIHETYQKHIDKRYFFKLFGDAFWVDISPENYLVLKENCTEFEIPNDNELTLDNNLDPIK